MVDITHLQVGVIREAVAEVVVREVSMGSGSVMGQESAWFKLCTSHDFCSSVLNRG